MGKEDWERVSSYNRLFGCEVVYWLILCVDLAGPQYLDMWSNIILDISVKVSFKMRVTFKSVDFE